MSKTFKTLLGIFFLLGVAWHTGISYAQCPPSSANMVVGPADCTSPINNGTSADVTLDANLTVGGQTSAIFVDGDLNVTGTGGISVTSPTLAFVDGVAVWAYGDVNYSASGDINAGDYGFYVLGDTTYSGGANVTAEVAIQSYSSSRSDVITVTDGNLTGTSGTAIDAYYGNDVVNLTINDVTLTGIVDGSFNNDTLALFGSTSDETGYNQFAACVAAPATCSGTVTLSIEGNQYEFANFEAFINNMSLIIAAAGGQPIDISIGGGSAPAQTGPQAICEGAIKVFRQPNGDLDVYSGFDALPPNGFMVGRITQGDLAAGIFRFQDPGTAAQLGWVVEVTLSNKLIIQVFDGQGNPVGNSCTA